MRAWRLNHDGEPIDVLTLEDIEIPSPGPRQLLIKVSASALALPDVMQCRGTYALLPPRPLTPGLEFYGTVVSGGEETSLAPETAVMGTSAFYTGHGAFADYCLAMESSAWPVPESMNAADTAAFTIAYHTAWIGLVRRARLTEGETVLVHGGAGGTGLAAIQLAKAKGARVISTSSGSAKQKVCSAAGADLAIDITQGEWLAAVQDQYGERGVDVVYDPVGGETFERSFECMAPEGRILPIGFASGSRGVVPMDALNLKNISVIGALGGGWLDRDAGLQMHRELIELYENGKLRANVDRKIDFSDIPQGLKAVADREVIGRIVALHEN